MKKNKNQIQIEFVTGDHKQPVKQIRYKEMNVNDRINIKSLYNGLLAYVFMSGGGYGAGYNVIRQEHINDVKKKLNRKI